jgi:hypothetical protein
MDHRAGFGFGLSGEDKHPRRTRIVHLLEVYWDRSPRPTVRINDQRTELHLQQLHANWTLMFSITIFSRVSCARAEYLALNPNGAAPTLVDRDFVLWESNAIMQYLADATGDTLLFPRICACAPTSSAGSAGSSRTSTGRSGRRRTGALPHIGVVDPRRSKTP